MKTRTKLAFGYLAALAVAGFVAGVRSDAKVFLGTIGAMGAFFLMIQAIKEVTWHLAENDKRPCGPGLAIPPPRPNQIPRPSPTIKTGSARTPTTPT